MVATEAAAVHDDEKRKKWLRPAGGLKRVSFGTVTLPADGVLG